MNGHDEQLLKAIHEKKGFKDAGISYDQFKNDMLASPEMRTKVYEQKGFKDAGIDFSQFEKDLGVNLRPKKEEEKTGLEPAKSAQQFSVTDTQGAGSATGETFYNTAQSAKEANIANLPKIVEESDKKVNNLRTKFLADGTDLSALSDEDKLIAKDEFRQAESAVQTKLQASEDAITAKHGTDWYQKLEKINTSLTATDEKLSSLSDQIDAATNQQEAQPLIDQYNQLIASREKELEAYNAISQSDEAKLFYDTVNEARSLKKARSVLFPDVEQREAEIAQKQKETDEYYEKVKASPGWMDDVGFNLKRRLTQAKLWTENVGRDIIAGIAGHEDFLGRDKLARRLRVGGESTKEGDSFSMVDAEQDIEWVRAGIPSALQGDYKEITSSFDEKRNIVFDESGRPQYLRDKKTGTRHDFKLGEVPNAEDAKKMFANASNKRSVSRAMIQGEQSLYDMLASILLTRGMTSIAAANIPRGASAAFGKKAVSTVSKFGIASTSTFQMFGDEYSQALAQGDDPDKAATDAFAKSAITGVLEATVGGMEVKLSKLGIAPQKIAEFTSKARGTIGNVVTGKLGFANSIKTFYAGAKSLAKETLGEVGEEVLQQTATDMYDSAVNGTAFDPISLHELENIAAPTIATVLIPGLISARSSVKGARRTAFGSILNRAVYTEPEVIDAELKILVKNGKISQEDADGVKGTLKYLKDEFESQDIPRNIQEDVTPLIIDRLSLEEKRDNAGTEKQREGYQSMIDQVQKQIDEHIASKNGEKPVVTETEPPAAEPAAPDADIVEPTTTPTAPVKEEPVITEAEVDTDEDTGDGDDLVRDLTEGVAAISPEGAEVSVDYFESGQQVSAMIDDNVIKGQITDVQKRKDGGTHAVEITDTDGKKHFVPVFGKTPLEVGIAVLKGKKTPPKPDAKPEKPVEPVAAPIDAKPEVVVPGEKEPETTTDEIEAKNEDQADELLFSGEAEKRRQDGQFEKDGIVYKRNKKGGGIKGKSGQVRFAKDLPIDFTYELIEEEILQPSHQQGIRNPLHFIPEAQPKSRTDQGSQMAERSFAEKPRFEALGRNDDAFKGAPVTNDRYEIIQGNNRGAGLKLGYKEGRTKYKEDLAKNAEEFGFTAEQVNSMKNPILVRVATVSDPDAINLGNYGSTDMETGGKGRIDPVSLSRRIPFSAKAQLIRTLFRDPDVTLNQAIRANIKEIMQLAGPYINVAQRNSLFKGAELRATGIQDLESLIQHFFFDGGDPALPEVYERLSHKQREYIRKNLPVIFAPEQSKSIIPEIQNAIAAVAMFEESGVKNFGEWRNQRDIFNEGRTPESVFSKLELAIANFLVTEVDVKLNKDLKHLFAEFADLVLDKEGDLLSGPRKGIEKEAAVKQVFGVTYEAKKIIEVAPGRAGSPDPEADPKAEGETKQTQEVKPVSAREAQDLPPEQIISDLSVLVPELKPIMDRALAVYSQLDAIEEKGGKGAVESFGLKWPFPYRIYSLFITSKVATDEKKADAISLFTKEVETSESLLKSSPPTDESLSTRKASVERAEASKREEIKNRIDEAKQQKEERERLAKQEVAFIQSVDPELASTIVSLLSKGVSKDTIRTIKRITDVFKSVGEPVTFSKIADIFSKYDYDINRFITALENKSTTDLPTKAKANEIIDALKLPKGRLLNEAEAAALQQEIESNYNDGPQFGSANNDIRTNMFNFDNPLAEKTVNGVNLKITEGLMRGEFGGNRRRTYLLYADGKIVGEFYSPDQAKDAIALIEKNLIPALKNEVRISEKKAERQIRDQKTKDDIAAKLAELKKSLRGGGPLTSGGLNPETIEKATELVGLYIKAGVRRFGDIMEDLYSQLGPGLKDLFDALKHAYGGYYNGQATDEEAAEMDPSLRNFRYDEMVAGFAPVELPEAPGGEQPEADTNPAEIRKLQQDESDRPGIRERDREAGTPPTGDVTTVPSEERGGGRGNRNADTERGGEKNRVVERGPIGGDLFTPPTSEQGDIEIHREDSKPVVESQGTGNFDGRGSSLDSTEGTKPDGPRGPRNDPGTQSQAASFQERQRLAAIKQKEAESIPAVIMDETNIRETLPYLLPQQQDDVIKAERRFFSPEHNDPKKARGKGMMFTNGTGTGKTFSGLGIAKRFQKMGKENILFVTPSQPNVKMWERDGAKLGLTITPLEDTSTGGSGMVVTTFANFRANEELLKREFDLIIFDESHRIMESKDGSESSTTLAHYMMGNKDEASALRRLQVTHKLWKREQEIRDLLRGDDIKGQQKQALEAELDGINEEQRRVTPVLKQRAKVAVDKTKVVFLSATPFKAHFNLRYANGFLFDWGDQDVTNNRGSVVDAESRFYLEHFGSAYEWKYHRLQTRSGADPDAISMQEIAFAERLMKEGVMSGRAIESDKDYSREFPKVTGFNSEAFDKAFNDIFNLETNDFDGLRDAARAVFMNYNYTTQLFESLKTSMSIPRIKKHLKMGRKLVIFHRRRQSDVSPPFESIYNTTIVTAQMELQNPYADGKTKEAALRSIEQAEAFKAKYEQLFEYEKTLNYSSAIAQLEAAFPGEVAYINGSISSKAKNEAIREFNNDNSHIKLIVVQEEAGKEGISLHDTTGKHQRILISLSMPISTTTALQVEGRIYRIGQESNAVFEYPLLGLNIETAYFGSNLNRRLGTTENLAMGKASRDLLRSYAEGVLFNSTTEDPHEAQGQGGVEYDKRSESTQSEFQKARLIYLTNQKTRGRRDQREGVDYFATPEPVGQKMVEWAQLRPGDHGLEPSAGHGAIAMWFPNSISATSIEPAFELYSKLTARAGGGTPKILNQRFEDHNIVNKYDGIVMNPPFGVAGKTAMDHIEKAFKHLKDGGRLVALIPNSPSMQKRLDDFLDRTDARGRKENSELHFRKEILLPPVTFQQAGTSVSTKIVIIDKVHAPEDPIYGEGPTDLKSVENINELFDRIEFVEVPDRIIKDKGTQSEIPSYDTNRNPTAEPILPVKQHINDKTGQETWSAKPSGWLGKEQYRRVAGIANRNNGWYSFYAKTFLFEQKEDAERFRKEANEGSDQQFVSEPESSYLQEPVTINVANEQLSLNFTSTVPDGQYLPESERPKPEDKNIRTLSHLWSQDRNFEFSGSTQIASAADVAHIMRLLETASVEHGFAVHVDKDGNSHIQFLATGFVSLTPLDPKTILAGAQHFKAVRTYLVHNHPSGRAVASEADIRLTDLIRSMFSKQGIAVEHVIMDTFSAEYLWIDEEGTGISQWRDTSKEPGDRLPVHKMDSFKALSAPIEHKLNSSRDVAEAVYNLRFSNMPKLGTLILNQGNRIIGNYVFKDGFNESELLQEFVTHPTATQVILYGNTPIMMGLESLQKQLRQLGINIVDQVHIQGGGNDVMYAYKSAADEGLLFENQAKYNTNQLNTTTPSESPGPSFSIDPAIQQAQEAKKVGNPNLNGPIIISLRDAQANREDLIRQYSGIWLDQIAKQHRAFYNRGLQLIKNTPYFQTYGDHRAALEAAIADNAGKIKKTDQLIAWVKGFWTRINKMLRLNITPEQLGQLTVQQYLDIAASQLRFSNAIIGQLLADGATDISLPQEEAAVSKEAKQKALEDKYAPENFAFDSVAKEVSPTQRGMTSEQLHEYEGRNVNATGTTFSDPKGVAAKRLLQNYSGDKRNLIETLMLLFPTLEAAGVKVIFHESNDSYYNAVTNHGGTGYQAVNSGGFYNSGQVHINLAKPDLKANTALHEGLHPVIRDLFLKDKPAATRFVREILKDPELRKKYYDNFALKYYSHLPLSDMNEEALVEATADVVLQRILRNLDNISDSLFDRLINYIKDVLGATYGKLFDYVNTKESFAAFANSLADGISRGMVIPISEAGKKDIQGIINESIQLSRDPESDPTPNQSQRSKLKAMLQHDILVNPEVNFEPIAAKLVAAGKLSQAEADDLLHGWRTAKDMDLTSDKTLHAIENMAELLHMRRMDETYNRQVKNANLQEVIEGLDKLDASGSMVQYSTYKVRELIEEIVATGEAHPVNVLRTLEELNEKGRPGGARDTVMVGIAWNELREARKTYTEIYNRTKSADAQEQIQYLDDMLYRLASAAKTNGSLAGSALGIRSKLLEFAGLTYESQMLQLEGINQRGLNKEIDTADKEKIRTLVDQINALQDALDKANAKANPKDAKAKAAEKQFKKIVTAGGNEAKPKLSKDEALALLKRIRATKASFSIAFSAAIPEDFSYYDIINELVKIAHRDGAKGFKEVVAAIQADDPAITEQDIYTAILRTTRASKEQAFSEYARRQALTKKHVRAINKLERMLTTAATNFLRKESAPEVGQINDVGKLLKEIEENIYRMNVSTELWTQWSEALEHIRTNYGLAFIDQTSTETTEDLLSDMLNAMRMLKDQKFHEWLQSTNQQLNEQLAIINDHRVSELIEQEDTSHQEFPTEMEVPVFDAEGKIIGSQTVPAVVDDQGTNYTFGQMYRRIQEKKKEIEAIKNKYRNRRTLGAWYDKLRGTLGSSLAMADLSYFAIQGFKMFVTQGHKKQFWNAFWSSLKAMRDEFRKNPGYANAIHAQIINNPYYDRAIAMGLIIVSPDAHVFVNEMVSADDWFDDWHEKSKGITKGVLGFRKKLKLASNAAFATHLNMLSMTTFANYIEKVKKATNGEMPSDKELRAIAMEINNATGRSNAAPGLTRNAAHVFWAPRLYMSQILNMANVVVDPIMFLRYALTGDINIMGRTFKGDKSLARAYKHRALNSMLFATMAAALYMLRAQLAKWQCGEDYAIANNPQKTNYLKILCGEYSFDPTGNMRQWIGFGFGLLSTWEGNPPKDYFGNEITAVQQFVNRFQYKLNPPTVICISLLGRHGLPGPKKIAGRQITVETEK